MARKCFISFKKEDEDYRDYIRDNFSLDIIDKSLKEPIRSDDEDYILRKIREDYLSDSTVTIHLIGAYGAENRGWHEQRFIKRELQASLRTSDSSKKSGILGVVLPCMNSTVWKGKLTCSDCGESHSCVNINDRTTISEFSYNYYIPHNKCSWSEGDRYCVLVSWEKFQENPSIFVDKAYEKRDDPISKDTRVKP